jgi:hypothetical protein
LALLLSAAAAALGGGDGAAAGLVKRDPAMGEGRERSGGWNGTAVVQGGRKLMKKEMKLWVSSGWVFWPKEMMKKMG